MNCWKSLVLSFVSALGVVLAAFGAQQQPQFQGGTFSIDPPCMPIFARVMSAEKDGVVNVSWSTAGRHRLPDGERGIDGKTVRYTHLTCFAIFDPANTSVMQADGKKLTTAEAWERLKVGTVLLVSMDTGEIAKEFLAQVKEDTLVVRIEEISLTESAGE